MSEWSTQELKSVSDYVYGLQQLMEVRDWHIHIDTEKGPRHTIEGVELGASIQRIPNTKRATITLPEHFFEDDKDTDENRARYLVHELCHLLIFPVEHFVSDAMNGVLPAQAMVMFDAGLLEQVEVLADTLSFSMKAYADATGLTFSNPHSAKLTAQPDPARNGVVVGGMNVYND